MLEEPLTDCLTMILDSWVISVHVKRLEIRFISVNKVRLPIHMRARNEVTSMEVPVMRIFNYA